LLAKNSYFIRAISLANSGKGQPL